MEKQRRDRQNADESFWYQLRHLAILKPVDPEDFSFALRLGSAAASGQMPMKSPARRDVTFENGAGRLQDHQVRGYPIYPHVACDPGSLRRGWEQVPGDVLCHL